MLSSIGLTSPRKREKVYTACLVKWGLDTPSISARIRFVLQAATHRKFSLTHCPQFPNPRKKDKYCQGYWTNIYMRNQSQIKGTKNKAINSSQVGLALLSSLHILIWYALAACMRIYDLCMWNCTRAISWVTVRQMECLVLFPPLPKTQMEIERKGKPFWRERNNIILSLFCLERREGKRYSNERPKKAELIKNRRRFCCCCYSLLSER